MMVRNLFGSLRLGSVSLGALLACVSAGCSRDVNLAGRKVPHVTVEPVTVEGVRLDEHASPEMVAYAALRAMGDDVNAHTPDERDAALARQFDLCAANSIQMRNRTTLDRDEFVYNVVYRWAPTISYYVDDFPTSWADAKARLVVRHVPEPKRIDPEVDEVSVAMEVASPSGDANARVVLMVWLARDEGLWRVVHTGFDQQRRSIAVAAPRTSNAAP